MFRSKKILFSTAEFFSPGLHCDVSKTQTEYQNYSKRKKFFQIIFRFFRIFFGKKISTESKEKERVQRKAIFWIMGNWELG